ncbi:MAG: hypothetical protein ACAH11_15765 [Sphingomonas sp.]
MMALVRTISASAIVAAAAMFATPAFAQQSVPQVAAKCDSPEGIRELDTNRALLDGLLKRRAEVVALGTPDTSKDALGFLDNRIAQIKARIDVCTPKG